MISKEKVHEKLALNPNSLKYRLLSTVFFAWRKEHILPVPKGKDKDGRTIVEGWNTRTWGFEDV